MEYEVNTSVYLILYARCEVVKCELGNLGIGVSDGVMMAVGEDQRIRGRVWKGREGKWL